MNGQVVRVELVSPSTPQKRVKKRRATPPKVVTKKAAQKRVKKAAQAKTTKKARVTTAIPVKKEAVSIDSTLKKIKERVRKREEETNLEERIERMKRERAEAAGRKSRLPFQPDGSPLRHPPHCHLHCGLHLVKNPPQETLLRARLYR